MNPDCFAPSSWKEARRQRAGELLSAGWRQREVAEALGVSEAALSQWASAARMLGKDFWRARPRPLGLTAKLPFGCWRLLPDLLSHGAEAHGFRGEVWTCARIAVIVREEFGVAYSPSHISRLLKALAWTPQLPVERASQRDEAAVSRWRSRRWPLLKKRRVKRAGA